MSSSSVDVFEMKNLVKFIDETIIIDPPEKIKQPMPKTRKNYLRFSQVRNTELTRREAVYMHYNTLHLKMTDSLHELSTRTGMPITQENGQRRYGPPLDYKGPSPQKGSEIFVGKLPRDLYEAELVPVFETCGNIFELRLMMDFSGTNRGYCFVQYYTAANAIQAIEKLNDHEIRPGRFIGVVKSVDNCRLFVGGLPRDKSKKDILEEIQKITEGVVRVIANPSPVDRTKNRGYAFIEYETHRSAAMARRKMIPGRIPMWGITVAVDWAEPEPDVQNLYVRNISSGIAEDELRDIFNKHSDNGVDKVKKIKDYAFVHFISRLQAEQAMNELSDTELDGGFLEISWAKPVNKVAHKARKAAAKQLYSNNGARRGSNDTGKTSSERIFGQYNQNALNYGNQHQQQLIYHQMAHQYTMERAASYQQYQNFPHGQEPLTPPLSLRDHGVHSGHLYQTSVSPPQNGRGEENNGNRIYGTFHPAQSAPGLLLPISHPHAGYRSGPVLSSIPPYLTQVGVGYPYIL